MASVDAPKGAKFTDNLGKIYSLYTLGFLAFFALMAIFEKMGASAKMIGIGFLLFTIAIYAVIGWLSRTMEVDAYYVAGREVPALYNGMATAADWMSGASFVALAGGVYFGGYPYLGFIVGWTGGYVLVNALMAPYLRKFGCYTVPDFIGTRYGGNFARFCAVVDSGCCLVHLCDGADRRDRYYRLPRIGNSLCCGRLVGPDLNHPVFDARWYARRDLDPGGPVYRSDRCLSCSRLLDVEQAWIRSHSAILLR